MLPRWTATLLWRLGVGDILGRRLTTGRRFVLVFHGVAACRYPDVERRAQPLHTAGELAATLAWLRARYTFLTPDAFFHSDAAGVLLTFDDGYANNAAHARPVLEQFQAPAIFFVSTQHVRDPADWLAPTREIARRHWPHEAAVPRTLAAEFYDGMAAGDLAACAAHPLITIGSHTVSHPILTTCTPQALAHELTASRRYLTEVTGRPVDLFAYPAGAYDRRVAEATKAAGYRAAFAVARHDVGLPTFEIPRVGLYKADPAYLSLKLSGLYRRPLPAGPLGA